MILLFPNFLDIWQALKLFKKTARKEGKTNFYASWSPGEVRKKLKDSGATEEDFIKARLNKLKAQKNAVKNHFRECHSDEHPLCCFIGIDK